jgi:hypothetical protein
VSKEGRESRTNAAQQQEQSRRAAADTETAQESGIDPRVDRARAASAVAGRGARGTQGKSRDARSVREARGANADRGNKPSVDEDQDEDEDEDKDKDKEEDDFWKALVAEAYRSRRRRGEWEIRGND